MCKAIYGFLLSLHYIQKIEEMPNKSYKIQKNESPTVNEPAVAYKTKISTSNSWNPNAPFIGTQEEWLEHFQRIEEGNFTPWEEAEKEFELWRTEYLASRLK